MMGTKRGFELGIVLAEMNIYFSVDIYSHLLYKFLVF
jgi:hypothetical protein